MFLFIYCQDQARDDPDECDNGCDGPRPDFQLVKTEVINDGEVETVTDVTENDDVESTEALKNDSQSIHFEDLIDTTT